MKPISEMTLAELDAELADVQAALAWRRLDIRGETHKMTIAASMDAALPVTRTRPGLAAQADNPNREP